MFAFFSRSFPKSYIQRSRSWYVLTRLRNVHTDIYTVHIYTQAYIYITWHCICFPRSSRCIHEKRVEIEFNKSLEGRTFDCNRGDHAEGEERSVIRYCLGFHLAGGIFLSLDHGKVFSRIKSLPNTRVLHLIHKPPWLEWELATVGRAYVVGGSRWGGGSGGVISIFSCRILGL